MDKVEALVRLQVQCKNLAAGVFLTLLFGGFGLFYLNIVWGVIGFFIEIILIVFTFLTFGLGIFILIGWHLLCMIVTVICINSHNQRLLNSL